MPTKTDQTDEKKRKGFDRFWRSKSDENRRFLMFDSDKILNSGCALGEIKTLSHFLLVLFMPLWISC